MGNYTIMAMAWMVPYEKYAINNYGVSGTIRVKKFCDVNGDGVVNVIDIQLCCINMGPVPPKPPQCDVNQDGVVNIIDIILCTNNMG